DSRNILVLKPFDLSARRAMNCPTIAVSVLVAVDAVDVVLTVERMATPRVFKMLAFSLDAETVEEHDCYVNPTIPRGLDPLAQTGKIIRIKFLKIEPKSSVQSISRPSPTVSVGRYP